MTRDEKTQLKTKPRAELETMLTSTREQLRVLRFDLLQGKVKNVNDVRTAKKDIARILTVLRRTL